jgi:hypothetical protein
MNAPHDRIIQASSEAAQRLREGDESLRRILSIAVLGPKMTSESEGYGQKRRQIYQMLRDAGHEVFYPEQRVNPDSHWARSEADVLASPDVDLIIALQTPASIGVFGELVAYSLVPEIINKTVVLTPAKYYQPDESYLANAISYYPEKIVYTDRHFSECCLLSDCAHIVNEFLFGESTLARIADF